MYSILRGRPAFRRSALAVAVSAGLAASSLANAGAVIFDQGNNPTTANIALGVNNFGHLNFTPQVDEFGWDDTFFVDNASSTGLAYKFPGGGFNDATSPGCECEGWGVAVGIPGGRISAYASQDNGGSGGIAGGTFGATPNSATSTVQMADANVSITHAYGVSLAPGVFQGNVTITNNEAFALTDLVYRRAMDWDVPPTEFDEYVTIQGVEANSEANGGNVRFSGDDGFFPVDPLIDPSSGSYGGTISAPANTDFVDNGPDDHGALFDFAFGDLAPGESFSFNIFYGAHASEADALAALQILGSEVYSLGQSNPSGGYGGEVDVGPFAVGPLVVGNPDGTPATFLFAFGGVSGAEIGTTQDNPILPFVPAPGAFNFPAPTSGRWFDPPFVDGFTYSLDTGDTFIKVGAPSGFDDMCIVIGGIEVDCDFDGGEFFDFGTGVTEFSITGISPTLDIADPGFSTAFPTFLEFTTASGSSLSMVAIEESIVVDPPSTSVPLPASLWLFGIGLGGMLTVNSVSRRRRQTD